MRYSKENLIDIGDKLILEDKNSNNPNYNWIDIVGIPQRPDDLQKSLFFATHSNGEGGWDNGFDRRTYAVQRVREKGGYLVIDESFQEIYDLE